MITLIFLQSHDWLPRIAQIEMLQQSLQKVFPQLPQGQIEITFVDASISQSINAEQRGKNAPTDVLSFSYLHDKILDDPHELLGEIFLCDSIIEQQAQEYGHTPQQEVLRLMWHGIIHILGFDHESDDEYDAFLHLERQIFQEFPDILIAPRYETPLSNIPTTATSSH